MENLRKKSGAGIADMPHMPPVVCLCVKAASEVGFIACVHPGVSTRIINTMRNIFHIYLETMCRTA